jgi:hypothetical protein
MSLNIGEQKKIKKQIPYKILKMKRKNNENYQKQIEIISIEAFKSDGFLMVNKNLIKILGIIPAILLSNYIDKYDYFRRKYSNYHQWFYLTHEQLMEQLDVSEFTIRKAKQFLIKKKMLFAIRRGNPSKEWFKINFSEITKEITKFIEDKNKQQNISALSKSEGLALSKSEGL